MLECDSVRSKADVKIANPAEYAVHSNYERVFQQRFAEPIASRNVVVYVCFPAVRNRLRVALR